MRSGDLKSIRVMEAIEVDGALGLWLTRESEVEVSDGNRLPAFAGLNQSLRISYPSSPGFKGMSLGFARLPFSLTSIPGNG